jgi:hypothetical protein
VMVCLTGYTTTAPTLRIPPSNAILAGSENLLLAQKKSVTVFTPNFFAISLYDIFRSCTHAF